MMMKKPSKRLMAIMDKEEKAESASERRREAKKPSLEAKEPMTPMMKPMMPAKKTSGKAETKPKATRAGKGLKGLDGLLAFKGKLVKKPKK